MKQERLDEIRVRAERATEGPWCWSFLSDKNNGYIVGSAIGVENDGAAYPLSGEVHGYSNFIDPILIAEHEAATCNYGDPDFIAHARQDIPDLLEALEQERSKARELLEASRSFRDALRTDAVLMERIVELGYQWADFVKAVAALQEEAK